MFPYEIKPMETAEEREGKGYVHYRSWQETYPGLIDPDYLAKHTLDRCIAAAHRWRDGLYVAKDGDKVIGFVGCGPYRDDTLPGHGEVYALYVLAAYHGQKVGYRLMRTALDRLQAYDRVAVWVLRGNDRAIRFYEKCGFHPDGTEAAIMLGTPNTELRMIYAREG